MRSAAQNTGSAGLYPEGELMARSTKASTTAEAGSLASDLPAQARLRLEHAGRWVAWDEGGRRVVAAADDYEAVREAARRAGVERAICEWLPPLEEARSTGGA